MDNLLGGLGSWFLRLVFCGVETGVSAENWNEPDRPQGKTGGRRKCSSEHDATCNNLRSHVVWGLTFRLGAYGCRGEFLATGEVGPWSRASGIALRFRMKCSARVVTDLLGRVNFWAVLIKLSIVFEK